MEFSEFLTCILALQEGTRHDWDGCSSAVVPVIPCCILCCMFVAYFCISGRRYTSCVITFTCLCSRFCVLSIYLCLSIYVSVCLSVDLSIYLASYIYNMFIYMSMCLSCYSRFPGLWILFIDTCYDSFDEGSACRKTCTNTGQHELGTDIYIRPCSEPVWNLRFQCLSGWKQQPRGVCDGRALMLQESNCSVSAGDRTRNGERVTGNFTPTQSAQDRA